MTDQADSGDETSHQPGNETSPGTGKRRPGKHRAGRPGFSRVYGWRIILHRKKEEGTTDERDRA